MKNVLLKLWADNSGFDVPEYAIAAVVLTSILVVMRSLNIHGSDLLADMGIRLQGTVR